LEYSAQQLKDFTGESPDILREAIQIESNLTNPVNMLKLIVADSDGNEIDLEYIQDLRGVDGVFNFKQLVADYDINEDNPILVKLPGK
jgi:hypothetical protein